MILLVLVLAFLGGAICSFLAVWALVPIVAGLIGYRHFAEIDALDNSAYVLMGGLMTASCFWGVARSGHWAHAWSIFPIIALIMAVAGILWLWFRGIQGRVTQFTLRGDQVIKLADGSVLSPVRLGTYDYEVETDAYHRCSFYGITLYDANGPLAANSYPSSEERWEVLQTILALGGIEAKPEDRLLHDRSE